MKSVVLGKGVVSLGLSVLCVAAPLSADTKQYSGVGCLAGGSSNTWTRNSFYFRSTTTGGSIGVFCPVARDRVGANNGPSGTMFVHDPSSSVQLLCNLYAQNSSGSVTSFSTADTTVAQTGSVTLTFASITSGTGSGDTYFFRCLTPTDGRIYAYRLVENAQTD